MAVMVLVAVEVLRVGDMSLQQKLPYDLMLTQWAQKINPVIANPIVQGVAINSVLLNAGVPKDIQTTLNRMQQGWFLIDNMTNSVVWRTQPFNSQILTLDCSADTTVSIWVF